MAKARNSFEVLAREASERLDAARAVGEQLALLPDEAGRTPVEVGTGKAAGGRPKGAMGKGTSQLRKWLTARGYRLPEDTLAEIAGLASGETSMLTAMAHADQVLTWAYAGSAGGKAPGPEQRMGAFLGIYAAMLRAADALLPFGAAKAAPDVAIHQQNVQVVLPAAPVQARDVAPDRPRIAGRMVPADVAYEIEQKQQVSQGAPTVRTDGKSDGEASD